MSIRGFSALRGAQMNILFVGEYSASITHLLGVNANEKFNEVNEIEKRSLSYPGELVINYINGTERPAFYYPSATIIVICFSVVKPLAFEKIKTKWIPEVTFQAPGVPYLVVGTKTDLRDSPQEIELLRKKGLRPVTPQQGTELVKKYRALKYSECSALTGQGMKDFNDSCINESLRTVKKKAKNDTRLQAEIKTSLSTQKTVLVLRKKGIDENLFPRKNDDFKELKSLILDENKLYYIPSSVLTLKHLEHLSVRNNQLVFLPRELVAMTSLKKLDVENNQLDDLPGAIGEMKWLEELKIKGNPLRDIPEEALNKGTQELLAYLRDAEKGTERVYRMKLMLVGKEAAGKTTLSQCLLNRKSDKPPLSTDGIDIHSWEIPVEEIQANSALAKENWQRKPLTFSIWDFAGQEVYYTTHQFFLTRRSIFLVIFCVVDEDIVEGDYHRVEYWLQSVQGKAKGCPIILVGTHADKLSVERCEDLMTKMKTYFTPRCKDIKHAVAVSSLNGRGFNKLRELIIETSTKQKTMGEQMPKTYLELENIIISKRKELLAKSEPPFLPFHAYRLLAMKEVNIEAEELIRATEFLHELGSLIYFNDRKSGLNNIVILDPQWLTGFMSTVISTKTGFIDKGILYHKFLSTMVWKGEKFPINTHSILLSLLEKFGIAHTLTTKYQVYRTSCDYKTSTPNRLSFQKDEKVLIIKKEGAMYRARCGNNVGFIKPANLVETGEIEIMSDQSLVPCLLPQERPEEELVEFWPKVTPPGVTELCRYWKFDFLPIPFFPQLMARMFHFSEAKVFWGCGLAVAKKGKALIELDNKLKKITVWIRGTDYESIEELCSLVDEEMDLLREWFGIQIPVYQILCLHCLKNKVAKPFEFSMRDCENAIMADKVTVSCLNSSPPTEVVLNDLVPDVSMSSFRRLNYTTFQMEKVLGSGAFAEVWRAFDTASNETVAVKKLKQTKDFFKSFRQEVKFMSEFVHENLVQLKGICLNPPCLTAEYMGLGTLTGYLKDRTNPLDWNICRRLLIDIARGMEFLHSRNKIHRDLKSPNVLMSQGPNGLVAKVADFGLSRTLAPTIGGRTNDNPIWLAPEIMRDEQYSEKADVYSFGVIVWEVFTRDFPFQEFKHMLQIEMAVLEGHRPKIPSHTPPFLRNVMKQSWHQEQNERPSFKELLVDLEKERHLICYKTLQPYSSDVFSVEKEDFIFIDEEDLMAMVILVDGKSLNQCTYQGVRLAVPAAYLQRACVQMEFYDLMAEVLQKQDEKLSQKKFTGLAKRRGTEAPQKRNDSGNSLPSAPTGIPSSISSTQISVTKSGSNPALSSGSLSASSSPAPVHRESKDSPTSHERSSSTSSTSGATTSAATATTATSSSTSGGSGIITSSGTNLAGPPTVSASRRASGTGSHIAMSLAGLSGLTTGTGAPISISRERTNSRDHSPGGERIEMSLNLTQLNGSGSNGSNGASGGSGFGGGISSTGMLNASITNRELKGLMSSSSNLRAELSSSLSSSTPTLANSAPTSSSLSSVSSISSTSSSTSSSPLNSKDEVSLAMVAAMAQCGGTYRTLAPKGTLLPLATKVDNTPVLRSAPSIISGSSSESGEVILDIGTLQLDSPWLSYLRSFNSKESIINNCVAFCTERGKLHDPAAMGGGIVCGRVKEIGKAYPWASKYQEGELVVPLATLSSLPMSLSGGANDNCKGFQLRVKGTLVVPSSVELCKLPSFLPSSLTLIGLDVLRFLSFTDVKEDLKEKPSSITIIGATREGLLLRTFIRRTDDKIRLVCADDSEQRLSFIEGIRVGDAISKLDMDSAEEMLKFFGNKESELVYNCSASPSGDLAAVLACQKGGRIVVASAYSSLSNLSSLAQLLGKNVTIRQILGTTFTQENAQCLLQLLEEENIENSLHRSLSFVPK